VSYDFLIYTVLSSMEGLPLAIALQEEGYRVAMAIMDERKAEPKAPKLEAQPSIILRKKLQQYVGEGLVEKVSADNVKLSKDTLTIFDFNYGVKYAQELSDKGIKGIMTPDWAEELTDRAKALQVVRDLYPELHTPEEVDFPTNSAKDILDFIKQSDEIWVIKPETEEIFVFLPPSDKETYQAQAEHYIQDNFEVLNRVRVQLQRKIIGYECCVETWYREGQPVLSNVDIELKQQYSGDLPPQTGCAANLVVTIPLNSELRRITNKPFDAAARLRKFTGLMDANVIFEASTGKPYFLEFCPARFGYNCLYTFLDKLRGGIGEFFKEVISGGSEVSVPDLLSASVRIFDAAHYGNLLHRLEEEAISFRDLYVGEPSSVWLWDVMKQNGQLKVVGANPNVAVVAASAPTAETSLKLVKMLAKQISFEGCYWRWDIDETGYHYAILDRLNYLLARGLLTAKIKRAGWRVTGKKQEEILTAS